MTAWQGHHLAAAACFIVGIILDSTCGAIRYVVRLEAGDKGQAHRSIAQEDPIRIQVDDLVCRVVSRHDRDFAAVRCKPAQNVVLGSKVVGHHLQARLQMTSGHEQ